MSNLIPNYIVKSLLRYSMCSLLFLSSCVESSQDKGTQIVQIPADVSVETHVAVSKKPKNVIFLIGDGMGLSQITAGVISSKKPLALTEFKRIGLVKTFSSKLITDSAASATAMATGSKTYNGAIAMNKKKEKLKTLAEYAKEDNRAVGIVTTATVTHATPACFYGHQPKRSRVNRKLAAEFMTTGIEVLMGGGWTYFKDGLDGRDLIEEAKEQGYFVERDLDKLGEYRPQKMLCLISPELPKPYAKRGDFLPKATGVTTEILSQDQRPFFLVVEGAQIDWGGHENKSQYIIDEVLDFDRAVAKAMEFAKKDGNTLVVVTADHETGGYSIPKGSLKRGEIEAQFTTDYHTATMVPIFAYGPGADSFTGIMDNTDIFYKIKYLMDF